MTDLIAAIESGDMIALHRILMARPEALRERDAEGLSPVTLAAYQGNREALARLLETGPELDLWEASLVGDADRVRVLVDEDPSRVRTRSPDGFTPLHLAVFFGHPEVAAFLLEQGADVSARSENALANQPLHAAVAGADPVARLVCARLLLSAGADASETQSGRFTPLMTAAQEGDRELVDLLLGHGADRSATDEQGRAAADHARSAGHDQLADLLRPT